MLLHIFVTYLSEKVTGGSLECCSKNTRHLLKGENLTEGKSFAFVAAYQLTFCIVTEKNSRRYSRESICVVDKVPFLNIFA